MQQTRWRSIIAFVAAAWFLVAALNLGDAADPVALALIDLGRPFLVGLAILSLTLIDARWTMDRAKHLSRWAAEPTT